jgi:hypothetical protein
MRQFMMMAMALVAFGAMVVTAQAENQTPRPSQVKRVNSYNECEKKARDFCLVHGQAGGGCYIWQCLGLLS